MVDADAVADMKLHTQPTGGGAYRDTTQKQGRRGVGAHHCFRVFRIPGRPAVRPESSTNLIWTGSSVTPALPSGLLPTYKTRL